MPIPNLGRRCLKVLFFLVVTLQLIITQDENNYEDEQIKSSDALFEEMSEIDDRIVKLQRRLHLINRIKSGKVKIPENLDIDNFELDDSFGKFDNFEDFNIDKYLTNKGSVSGSEDEEIVEYTYIKPANFLTISEEVVSEKNQLLLVLYSSKKLRAFSSSTLSLVSEIDLSSHLSKISCLKSDVVTIHPVSSQSKELYIIILSKSGDVFTIELGLQSVKIDGEEPNENNSTHKRKKRESLRVPKTLVAENKDVANSRIFNVWDLVIESNSTLYEEEILKMKEDGLVPVSLEYFGKGIDGNYIIADSKGYFNIFRKSIDDKNTRKPGKPNFALISRAHSDFDKFDIISRHNVFAIFSRGSSMGFLRTFDGQMVKSSCEVGTQQIVSIAHDPNLHGRLYVGTDNGEIIIFSLTQNKRKIGCSIEGKITGDPSNDYMLYPLNRFLVKVERTGDMAIYNITDTKVDGKIPEFGSIKSTKHKPEELEGAELSFLPPKALVNLRSSSITFHITRDEGKGELTVIEFADPVIPSESFLSSILENKAVVIVIPILILLFYHMFIKKSGHERREASFIKKAINRKTEEKASHRLDDLTKRLASLDQTNELLAKMGRDPKILDPGKPQRRNRKYGNKVDFLE